MYSSVPPTRNEFILRVAVLLTVTFPLSIQPGDVLMPLLAASSGQPRSVSVVLATAAPLAGNPGSRSQNTAWPPKCMQSKFYVTKSVQQVEASIQYQYEYEYQYQKQKQKQKQHETQILKQKQEQKQEQDQLQLQLQLQTRPQMASHV
ncbi:hypothetical protein KR038_011933 [Drosophila bunnanda]|nr:hypothetical protein KR038_011933 [Drosophila bunnanda]